MALDLSSDHISKWRKLLPPNVLAVVGDDATPEGDVLLGGVIAEMEAAAPRRVLSVFDRHADAIVAMGRARRMRLMAWMDNRFMPDTNLARDLMRDFAEDDGDEGGGGRAKIAPLFRAEYEALLAVVRPYIVQNAQSHETVGALHAGIVEFSRSSEMTASGM
jgi:hypothetical protein